MLATWFQFLNICFSKQIGGQVAYLCLRETVRSVVPFVPQKKPAHHIPGNDFISFLQRKREKTQVTEKNQGRFAVKDGRRDQLATSSYRSAFS